MIIGGVYYRIEPETSKFKGMGGRPFDIRVLATGEVFRTHNLWMEFARVPAGTPDDAEFLNGAGFRGNCMDHSTAAIAAAEGK